MGDESAAKPPDSKKQSSTWSKKDLESIGQQKRNTKEFLKPTSSTQGISKPKLAAHGAARQVALFTLLSALLLGSTYVMVNQTMRESRLKQKYDLAQTFLKGSQPRQAVQQLSEFITAYPTNSDARLMRAEANLALAEYKTAIDDFDVVIAANPNDYKALSARAVSYLKLDQPERSIADCTAALKAKPDFLPALQTRSLAYTNVGKFKEAIADSNRVIDMKPAADMAQAYSNRGYAYLNQKQFKPALADLNRSLEMDPKSGDAYAQRARCYVELNQLEQALIDCNKAIFWSPLSADAYLLRAECFEKSKQTSAALSDLDKAVGLHGDATTYGARAKLLISQGNYKAALNDLEALLAKRGVNSNQKAYVQYEEMLALCKEKTAPPPSSAGSSDLLAAATEPVIEIKGSFDDMMTKGYSLLQDGKPQQAVLWLAAASKSNSQDARAHSYLAHALISAGRSSEAVPHFVWLAKAGKVAQEDEVAYARCLQDAGQLDEAAAMLGKILNKDPNNNVARFHLARTLVAKTDRKAAAEVCRVGIAKSRSAQEEAPFREMLQRLEHSFAQAQARVESLQKSP